MIWSSPIVSISVMAVMILTWPLGAIAAQLSLTWDHVSTTELGFSVERSTGTTESFSEVARTGPDVTSYTDTTVADATTYCYRVRAFDAVGYSEYSNVACGTPAPRVSLAVVRIDAGAGTVTSAPAGINCGASCSATYASGTAVTLTAAAATGSTFAGWSGGGCGGTGTCTVTLTAATTVTANFALKSASAFSVAPQSLTFSKIAGQSNPASQTVTVTAPAALAWTTHDALPFADVTGLPGVPSGVTGTGTAAFKVVPSSGMTSLGVGVYRGSITVTASGFADIVIPVQVVVTAASSAPPEASPPPTALSVSPQSLTFSKVVGQSNPPAQSVTVTAGAGHAWTTRDTMPFANVTGLPYNGADGVTGTGTATVTVAPSDGMNALTDGVYTGYITVSTAGAADIVISVQVVVTTESSAPPPPPTALSVSPQSLTFSKIVGQSDPPAQSVTVTAGAEQAWTTRDTMPFANVNGLPEVPSGVTGTGTAAFNVVPSTGMSSLPVGVHTGSITVSTAGAADLVITVQVIVTGP